MDRSTKYCELTFRMASGETVSGRYHVGLRTSSTVRPSDAIHELKGGFLVLSDAVIVDAAGTRHHPALMIRLEAVSLIELPPVGWVARLVSG